MRHKVVVTDRGGAKNDVEAPTAMRQLEGRQRLRPLLKRLNGEQPDPPSASVSGPTVAGLARISAWSLLSLVAFATLGPLSSRPRLSQDPQTERGVAYFILGYLFALGYPRARVGVAVGMLVGAVGLEAAQLLTVDRHAQAPDAIAKALGGVVGVFAVVAAQAAARLPGPSPHGEADGD